MSSQSHIFVRMWSLVDEVFQFGRAKAKVIEPLTKPSEPVIKPSEPVVLRDTHIENSNVFQQSSQSNKNTLFEEVNMKEHVSMQNTESIQETRREGTVSMQKTDFFQESSSKSEL